MERFWYHPIFSQLRIEHSYIDKNSRNFAMTGIRQQNDFSSFRERTDNVF